MPLIGSAPNKTFQRTDGTRTGSQVYAEQKVANVFVTAALEDTHDQDMADALSLAWYIDGSTQPSANLTMNSKKFTGVANASARTEFAAAGQVADSAFTWAGTSSGNDTITASVSPAITAYAAGQAFRFLAGGTNTGAATINLNSVGAVAIKKGKAGATAMAAGDITAGGTYEIVYDGTNFQLLNPGVSALADVVGPASSTDNAIVRFDSTTGKLLQDSSVTIDDSDNLSTSGTVTASAGLNVDSNAYYALSSSNPILAFDTNDYLTYDRTANSASVVIGGSVVLNVDSNGGATQAEMEAASSTVRPVVPARQHSHPGHPKVWGKVTETGGNYAVSASYNLTSITDNGPGDITCTIATDFLSANYAVVGSCESFSTGNQTNVSFCVKNGSQAAGSFIAYLQNVDDTPNLNDATFYFSCHGDQ